MTNKSYSVLESIKFHKQGLTEHCKNFGFYSDFFFFFFFFSVGINLIGIEELDLLGE